MSSTAAAPPGLTNRFLTGVERVGNKLPDPFMLFLILFAITAVVTSAMALGNVTVEVPGAEEATVIRGLFTAEGMTWLTENIGPNYLGFPPLATVLPILLAVGVAEKSGLLSALIRRVFGSAPRWTLPYAVGFVGVVGSVMSDSAFVIIPPLAALVFKAAGRHPVAGLLGGFAAVGAGYSTNVVVTSLDALFAGITTAVTENLPNAGAPVTPLSNYYFNIASSLALIVIAGFIIDKILEPRLGRQNVPVDEIIEDGEHASSPVVLTTELTPLEARGLKRSVIVGVVVALVILVAVIVPGSPWRNDAGGFLPRSPLLSSIVFIVFLLFTIPGLVYGKIVGTITTGRDVPRVMGEAIKDMAGFLVLAFILGQFIALFNWSGIGSWIAVAGASGLEAIGLTGYPAVLAFVLLASVLNLFIVSGSSMWTLMASVFVPLFAVLGYEPAFIQGAFRVGDSATQVITPLNPYMIVLLTMLRKYEPQAGLGTLMARMLPFVVPLWLAWAAILTVFFYLDLPLGPGNGIFIQR